VSADGCLPGLFNLTENRTERIGMAMSNEPTVVELTFEGYDRVFFSITNIHTMAEEDQAAAAYLESYDDRGIPVRLNPRLTMAMFEGGASKDEVLAHLREQAERTDAEQALIDALTSVIKINSAGGARQARARMPDELAWARPP
jgi:hypothetical protein